MEVSKAINIADLEQLARKRLPTVVADYLCGAAEDEVTLRENRAAFQRYSFAPRVLTGHGKPDLSVNLFGTTYSCPFAVGPTGLNGLFWKDGDICLAQAAADAGIGFALSAASNNSLEEVAEAVTSPKWFQLYPWGDLELSRRLIERVRHKGYEAIFVTIDALTPGKRERDLRNNFAHEVRISPKVVMDGLRHPSWLTSVWLRGGMPRMENLAEFTPPGTTGNGLAEFMRANRNPYFSWNDVQRLRDQWHGPLVLKGVLSAEDALEAERIGLQGVVISNHGGRQLDGAPASIDVLPEIANAVSDETVVLIDSGFRRGSDIVKAVACGADGVLLGRATLFGLSAGGQEGVAKTISILRDEISRVMALIGCPSVAKLSKDYLRPASAANKGEDNADIHDG